MGCGKTTIGKLLARRLGLRFVDTDSIVERQEGATISDIFYYEGEAYFRELEVGALSLIDKMEDFVVVATGGGLPVMGDNMETLQRMGATIYLKRPVEQIIKRLSPYGLRRRPKLSKLKPEELLEYMTADMQEREPFYLQSQLAIDCTSMSDKSVVDDIILNLGYGE